MRAWRNADSFEGRSSVRSWLYRIATNVCIDMQRNVQRRARPMEMGPSSPPVESHLGPTLPEALWITPIADASVAPESTDPAEVAEYRESIRLAFVAALQHLPARQRAALILCEVLALAGQRSSRAPRHQRRRDQQRPAAGPCHDECRPGGDAARIPRRCGQRALGPLCRCLRALRHRAVGHPAPRRCRAVDAPVRHVDPGGGEHRTVDGRARPERMPGLAPAWPPRPTAVPPSVSTDVTREAGMPRGPCRCSRSRTGRSPA